MADISYTSAGDAKRQLWYGSNEITKSINVGIRIMLTNKTTFRITHINDFEYNGNYTGADGLTKALVLQTALINEDDLVNNVAWNPIYDEDDEDEDIIIESNFDSDINKISCFIMGDNAVYIGSKNKYKTSDDTQVKWELDSKYSCCNIVSSENNECVLEVEKSHKYVGMSVSLIAKDEIGGQVLDIKTIIIRG